MTENAETLGIGRATAYRYWNQWLESAEAQQIDAEWWAEFNRLKKKSPIKAFEGLTRLKVRKMAHKLEVKKEVKTEHRTDIHILLEQYEGIIERAAERNLPKDRA